MFIKICAIALMCGIVFVLIDRIGVSLSFGVKIAATVILGSALAIMIQPVLTSIYSIASINSGAGEYTDIVIRSVGVAILAHICADICRDCNESTVAGAVILAGKIEIIVLCLPMVEKIIAYAIEILNTN